MGSGINWLVNLVLYSEMFLNAFYGGCRGFYLLEMTL
jgi:hypothetical protein